MKSLLARANGYLITVVAVAFFIRMCVVVFLISNGSTHSLDYNNFGWESWEMGWTARSIVLGQGFSSPFLAHTGPTALVPPLYPYILATVFHVFGRNTMTAALAMLGFNSLCSALTCVPLYLLALHTLGLRAAKIVAIAWAVYPYAIYFSAGRVWDYALTGLLFSCCLLMAHRLPARQHWYWAAFGLLYGLTVLSNPSVASLLPFLLMIPLYKLWRAGGAWFGKGLLALAGFILMCIPWTVRNQKVMHSVFFIRDGFWLEFYAGNNGDTSEPNCAWAHPASNPVEMKKYEDLGEIKYMQKQHELATAFVRAHPGLFAIATVRRIVRFWTGYWSLRPGYLKYEPFDLPNIPFCLFLLYFTAQGLRRWWKRDSEACLPYLLAAIIFPVPYYLTHSSMDYRQPLEPILVLLVSIGVCGIEAGDASREDLISACAEPETVLA